MTIPDSQPQSQQRILQSDSSVGKNRTRVVHGKPKAACMIVTNLRKGSRHTLSSGRVWQRVKARSGPQCRVWGFSGPVLPIPASTFGAPSHGPYQNFITSLPMMPLHPLPLPTFNFPIWKIKVGTQGLTRIAQLWFFLVLLLYNSKCMRLVT